MRRQINNILSIAFSAVRFGWLKLIHGDRVHADLIERFSPNVVIEITRGARLILGKRVRAHSGCKFKVRRNAELNIGDGVKINYNCIFACHEKISIGNGTEFGPSVYIYDHDHDFRAGLKENKYKCAPVSIGKNCWIGANTVILRGTTIGDDCIIGAGSVINGEFPSHTVIIQRRKTETSVY